MSGLIQHSRENVDRESVPTPQSHCLFMAWNHPSLDASRFKQGAQGRAWGKNAQLTGRHKHPNQ
jgi:hypothetical protein